MQYEKAKAETIRFEGSEYYMIVTSAELSRIAQAIAGVCGFVDRNTISFTGPTFTCGQFDGVSPQNVNTYELGGKGSYTYTKTDGVWNCTSYD